jgi:Tol biopolymer transport system component
MKALAAKIILVPLLVIAGLASGSADATPPGENGRIAYRLFFNTEQTRAAIFTINPDGSDKHQVTHPRRRVLHLVPDWSADGRWIVFVRTPLPDIHPRLWKIRPDGSGRRSLGGSCTEAIRCRTDDDPAWSPSGSQIAFTRVFGGSPEEVDLMTMRADGTHVHHITNHPEGRYADWQGQWSPNGHRLVFQREDHRRSSAAIFTIRPDGTGARRITPWMKNNAGFPDWSPDGMWILFVAPLEATQNDLWLVHPDGSELRKITDTPDVSWSSGSFSPDGTMIVTGLPGVGDANHTDVYVMNVDGTGLQNITESRKLDSSADWGPA